MAGIVKRVLGQNAVSAATATKIYTVPASTQTTISTITACNRSATVADRIGVAIRVAGAANATNQYLYGDGGSMASGLPVAANDTFAATLGITLAETDEVWVYSVNGSVTFNLFGAEEVTT